MGSLASQWQRLKLPANRYFCHTIHYEPISLASIKQGQQNWRHRLIIQDSGANYLHDEYQLEWES
jgi:hypothetical protein